MIESLPVALILKRIAPLRCLLSLFAAVLGLCVNCKADSLSVYSQFDFRRYGGNGLEFMTDPGSSSGLRLSDPHHTTDDYILIYNRIIDVPALPAGAVVTSATFSLFALSGSLDAENGSASILGTTPAQPQYVSAESLDPFGPCTPTGCAPTIATVSVAYRYILGRNCLDFTNCFTTPATGNFDLLSLGISPTYFADGFSIGPYDTPDALWGSGASIDTVLYSGFNSETDFNFSGIGPQLFESVALNYTVPEPISLVLILPGLAALLFLQKINAHKSP